MRDLRRMLASDLVRALPNRCLRDIFFVIAHLLGVTPVLAARRGPNGCRVRLGDAKLTTPASPRRTWPRTPCPARSPLRDHEALARGRNHHEASRWCRSLTRSAGSLFVIARSGGSTQHRRRGVAISDPSCREQRPPSSPCFWKAWSGIRSLRSLGCRRCQLLPAGQARRTNCASSDPPVRRRRLSRGRAGRGALSGDVRLHALVVKDDGCDPCGG
jgi:hypothetical protein